MKNKNKTLGSQYNRVATTLCFVFIFTLMTVLFSHFCFALSSDNYKISEDLFTSGKYSASDNYAIQDYIGDEITIIEYTVPGGGSGGPVTPPPPPPPPPEDITAPIISDIAVSEITENSAKITWTTDENSSTGLDYGETLAYELGSETGLGNTLSHEIILINLLPGSTYHFVVKSADEAGNNSVSLDHVFATLPDSTIPIISDITVTDITGISAKINWTTDEPTNSVVDYGETSAYETGSETISDLILDHSVLISGLTPSTLYHFRVRSTDDTDNEAISSDQIFSTIDTIPPLISGINAQDITSNSARIEWLTNEISTGLVGYGSTIGYEDGVGISAIFSTIHGLNLSGLIGNTTYHFRITATDPAGNESASTDFIFTTAKDGDAPSNILNFMAEPDKTFVILTWDNPPDPDFSGVHIIRGETGYPTVPGEGELVFNGLATSAVDRGLIPGTIYYYTAFSYDTSENFSSGAVVSTRTLGLIPPEEIPEEIPKEIPEEIIEEIIPIKLENFAFLVAQETINLPIIGNQIKTIVGAELIITILKQDLTEEHEFIILKIDDSSYLFTYNEKKERYETKITTPINYGVHKSVISIIYSEENAQFINFDIFTDNLGLITEIFKGEERVVPSAIVTLYVQNEAGNWIVWDSAPYNQANPITTDIDGNYYFLALKDLYYLTVEKDGYRILESAPIDLRDVVINKSFEILKPPPKLIEIIDPEAPLIENIQAITENLTEKAFFGAKIAKEEVVQIIDDPRVEDTNTTIAVPTVAIAVVANAGVAISFLNLLNYLRFLLTQPFLLLERKKRKGWGSVYHAFTKLPIDLAIVRLRDAKTKQIIQTRVTDKQGRFAFIVSKGKYILEVTKPGFIFPTKTLKKLKEDAGLKDIYYGGSINIGEEGETIMVNIPLDPVEKKGAVIPKKILFKKFLKSFNHTVAFSGVGLSLVSFIISPSVLLGGFFIAQIALYFIFRRLAVPKKPKAWGIVYDKKDKKPLSYVIARLFETEYNKLLETQITDSRGRYVFLAGRNTYYATFEKENYEKRKTDQIDLRKAAKENVVALDIGLNKK